MYYFKAFIIYSILGFILESTLYKITNSNKHSGVLYGPYTFVYGFGGILINYIYNLFNFNINIYLKIFLLYLIFTITCTIIEYSIGHLIHFIYKIDKWDYSNHKYHYGKYICLLYALLWGLLSIILIYFGKDFINNIINSIHDYNVIFIYLVFTIDFIITTKKSLTSVKL